MIPELISIAIVTGNGSEYYAVSSEFQEPLCGQWLQENVIPRLDNIPRKPLRLIAQEIQTFVTAHLTPDDIAEFWADCRQYDWIILRSLFGLDTPPLSLRAWKLYLNCAERGAPTPLPNRFAFTGAPTADASLAAFLLSTNRLWSDSDVVELVAAADQVKQVDPSIACGDILISWPA